jgi:hypothetical protein
MCTAWWRLAVVHTWQPCGLSLLHSAPPCDILRCSSATADASARVLPSHCHASARVLPSHCQPSYLALAADHTHSHVLGWGDALPCPCPAAVVLSPAALARLDGVDASQALALPGVLACLTAEDIPSGPDTQVLGCDLLAWQQVLYVGQPVALVLAESQVGAAAAAAAVAAAAAASLSPACYYGCTCKHWCCEGLALVPRAPGVVHGLHEAVQLCAAAGCHLAVGPSMITCHGSGTQHDHLLWQWDPA